MRQLFNKSGTVIVFFAATFFLCTFLISLFSNAGSSDIYKQFSDNAEYVVIHQNNNADGAVTYNDIADKLSAYPIKGAVIFDMGSSETGLMLFNYIDGYAFRGVFGLIDVNSPFPQTIIKPMYQACSMNIDGKPTVNVLGKEHEIVGLNIYTGLAGEDYICNIAGLKNNLTVFQGLTMIIDSDGKEPVYNFLNDVKKMNDTVTISSEELTNAANLSGGIDLSFIFVVIIILLIGLLLLLNSGVFVSSWIRSKKSEIAARRICGASGSDIKKLIFADFFIVSFTGTFIGFLVTFAVINLTGAVYFFGRIDPMAGLISALFITAVSIVIAYEHGVKYSDVPIVALRRE